jgi:ABC-2 type transport system permease protein
MTSHEQALIRPIERPDLVTPSRSVLRGAGVIFRKELREWFATRRFVVMTVITSALLACVPTILFLHEGGLHDGRINSGYSGLLESWVALSLTLGSYLVVAVSMGMLIKEEETGTAQWLFTKPVSRVGYVLAKYFANAVVVLLGAVVIPGLTFLALAQVVEASGIQDWTAMLETFGFIALNALVVLGIVVGLSVLVRGAADNDRPAAQPGSVAACKRDEEIGHKQAGSLHGSRRIEQAF